MDDLISRLTNNFQYGTDIVLLLEINDQRTSLHYLDYLNITGKEIENLKNCMPIFSLDYLTQTIRFLRSGYISENLIHENLNSNNPVNFIPRLLEIGENWENAYEDFAGEFFSKIKRFKSR